MKHSFWKGFRKEAGSVEVACVAVLDGNKILMGKRKDNGKWTNPGGHMEPGETPVQGACRELFEESGIKAKPEDLEHLATKHVTKPDGKKLTIYGFKYDEGKHKTSIKGDPDEEVYRWLWKPIPLPAEVAENLHVQKQNVLLDALKIDYPQEKTASMLMDLIPYRHEEEKKDKPKEHKKKASFYNAVVDHMSQAPVNPPLASNDPSTQPPEPKDEAKPHEKTEHAGDDVPAEKTARPIAEKLRRLRLRRGETQNVGNQVAQFMAQREDTPHDHA